MPPLVAVQVVAASAVKMLDEGVMVTIPAEATAVLGVKVTTRSPPASAETTLVPRVTLPQVTDFAATSVYPGTPNAVASTPTSLRRVKVTACAVAPLFAMLLVHVITFTTSLSKLQLLVTLRTEVLVVAPEVRAQVVPADEAVTLVLAVQVVAARLAEKIASEAVSVRILVAATVSLGVNANTRLPPASLLTVLPARVTPASADVAGVTVV